MLLTNLLSLYLLSVTVAVVFCAVKVRSLNGSNHTKTALLLCFAVCFYILGYTMELNSSSPSQIQFWNRMEYIGIPFVSALWLTTGVLYTDHFTRYRKSLVAAIFLIPAASLILRLTNDWHHLYFASINYAQGLGGLILVKRAGPWMYVQTVHSTLMIFAAMGLFLCDAAESGRRQTGKAILIVASTVFAVAGLFLKQVNPFKIQVDYMALCLPVTCVLVILAISRFDLLKTKTIGRGLVFEASRDAILLISRQNRALDYNSSAKRLFQQVDVRLDNRVLPILFGEIAGLPDALKKTEPTVIKLRVNDEQRYYDITTVNIDDHGIPRGWIKTIRDVTEIYLLNEELKRQAMTDELSSLNNRRAFVKIGREWLEKCEESQCALHLIMMDLDHFKDVNDQYGHPTGDLVIRDFAQILKSHFGPECLTARLGGEEFAVLLSGFDDDGMRLIVNTLLTVAGQRVYGGSGNQFHVTVSIGLTKKQPGQTLESMMGRADRALYQSKARGRNCITMM